MQDITVNVKNDFGSCELFPVDNGPIINSLAITFTVNN